MLFKKSQLGWRLLMESFTFCCRRPKLLIFPGLGRGFFLIIVGIISYFLWEIRSGMINYYRLTTADIIWIYLAIILALWFGNFVGFYFNAALTAGFKQVEQQQKILIAVCLRQALVRLWTIFCWVLAHYTFGFMLLFFHQKLIKFKKINYLLSGLSWTWASFFMLPLIIHEPAGFFTTLQRSSQIMRAYAGDKPKLRYRYGFLSYSLRIFSVMPMAIGLHFSQTVWIVSGIAVTFLLMLTTMVIFNVFFVGVTEALYQYVVHNKIIWGFHKKDLTAVLIPGFSV